MYSGGGFSPLLLLLTQPDSWYSLLPNATFLAPPQTAAGDSSLNGEHTRYVEVQEIQEIRRTIPPSGLSQTKGQDIAGLRHNPRDNDNDLLFVLGSSTPTSH